MLTSPSFLMTAGYTLSSTGTFGATSFGPGSQQFSLTAIPATWNSLFLQQYTIANSGTQDFDLSSFDDLIGEAAGMMHIFGIMVTLVSGGPVKLSPGGTNALQWFFSGATTATYVTIGLLAGFSYFLPVTATGQVVNGGAGTLRLTNSSGSSLTVNVLAFGSTT